MDTVLPADVTRAVRVRSLVRVPVAALEELPKIEFGGGGTEAGRPDQEIRNQADPGYPARLTNEDAERRLIHGHTRETHPGRTWGIAGDVDRARGRAMRGRGQERSKPMVNSRSGR